MARYLLLLIFLAAVTSLRAQTSAFAWYCRTLSTPDAPSPVLANACEFALSAEKILPDFVCEQTTIRRTPAPDPGPLCPTTSAFGSYCPPYRRTPNTDTVTAQVTYLNGEESYSNVKISGKSTAAGMLELAGMSSIGEFGTTLRNVFDPDSATKFSFKEEKTVKSRPTLFFEFRVAPPTSKWNLILQTGLGAVAPGYHGILWIDKQTSRIVHLEQNAEVDSTFPYREVSLTIDYSRLLHIAHLGESGRLLAQWG